MRKEFLKGLVGLQRNSDGFVGPVIRVIERLLSSGTRTKVSECCVKLLGAHEAYLCS